MRESSLNYRDAIARRLGVLKSCIILDAGTGAGSMTKALSNGLGLSVVSIDANKRVFPHVLENVDRKRVDFVACDFAHLPFREAIFCAIVCDLAISTSREWKPFPICAEFKRALRTGSWLFITDYYPEESPRTREALLAKETSRLYRAVSKAKGARIQKGIPPRSTVRQLRKMGFVLVKKKKIEANEGQEWKKRVLEEYYNVMKTEISGLNDLKLRARYMKRLEELKGEIDSDGRITWGWGVNYLIQARK